MAGLFSPRSGRGHFRGGLEEAAWEGRLSSRSPSFSDSRSIPRGLAQPGRPTDIAPHPHSGVKHKEQGHPARGQWAGHSFPATSPFALRAPQAGLDWAGSSRFQHSRGAQGGQAPGIGVGKRLTRQSPEASYQELAGSRSCRHAQSFGTHTHVVHTHTHTIHTQTHPLGTCMIRTHSHQTHILSASRTQNLMSPHSHCDPAPLTRVRQWKQLMCNAFQKVSSSLGPLSPRQRGHRVEWVQGCLLKATGSPLFPSGV